jgi:hypothetical protein
MWARNIGTVASICLPLKLAINVFGQLESGQYVMVGESKSDPIINSGAWCLWLNQALRYVKSLVSKCKVGMGARVFIV